MKKVFRVTVFVFFALILTACSNAEAKKELTAQEVFEKAKEASDKLEQVRTTVVFEDFWGTLIPDERMSVKYEMTSDASFQPDTFRQQVIVHPSGEKSRQVSMFKVNDRIFIKEGQKQSVEELPSGSMTELFGKLISSVNPTLDLTIFEAFEDDFELEKIDYGYRLKLALSREQYKEFRKIMLDNGDDAVLSEIENGFPVINKFEMEIGIDGLTYFVSNFKMTMDTTTYSTTEINGNSHRVKQKISAGYSRFNDIDAIDIPNYVLDAVAK